MQQLYWALVMPSCVAMAIAGFYVAYKVGRAADAITRHYEKLDVQ